MIFAATKKVGKQIPPSFVAVVVSGMDKNQDPGQTSWIHNFADFYNFSLDFSAPLPLPTPPHKTEGYFRITLECFVRSCITYVSVDFRGDRVALLVNDGVNFLNINQDIDVPL